MIAVDEAVITCRYHAELAAEIESLTSRILSRAEAGQASGLEDDVRSRLILLKRLTRLARNLYAIIRKNRRRCDRGGTSLPALQADFMRRHAASLTSVRDQDRRIRLCLENIRAAVQQDRLAIAHRRKTTGLYGSHPTNHPRYVSMTT